MDLTRTRNLVQATGNYRNGPREKITGKAGVHIARLPKEKNVFVRDLLRISFGPLKFLEVNHVFIIVLILSK